MAIENINDLDTADILDENGNIKEDLYLAIYKDDTMNFTKFKNLPIPLKPEIDNKIENFEKEMTLKMQECNIINEMCTKDETTGEIVGPYLKLNKIIEAMNSYKYKEIGVRYNISVETGLITHSSGKNIIKRGAIMMDEADLEASNLSPSFNTWDNSTNKEIANVENIFARDYYPWNKMSKVQISLDNSNYNYDLDIDNGGNYFTEVPLYYVKQQYVIEKPYLVTAYDGTSKIKYNEVIDITNTWNPIDTLSSIPEEYRDSSIYSVGMYKFVSEYPLPGYRPASFFIDKTNKIPEKDSDTSYDSSVKRYVQVTINGEIYYILYKNYLNSNLKESESPVLYCLEKTNNNEYLYNTNILTFNHYFGCYEAAIDNDIAISRPNAIVEHKLQLKEFRSYVSNLGEGYYIEDIRSKTDFYDHLIDIEFGTLNSINVIGSADNFLPDMYTGNFDKFRGRNSYLGGSEFRWNWIENPYGSLGRYLDGILVKHNIDINGNSINSIYYCNNYKMYNMHETYTEIPYIDLCVPNTNNSKIISMIGYNSKYPWIQLPSKTGNDVYGANLYENSSVEDYEYHNDFHYVISYGIYLRYFELTQSAENSNRSMVGFRIEKMGD